MPAPMDERLNRALKQIREDEALTADLTDHGSAVVLEWLEGELRVVGGANEQQLARRAEELRRAVKQVARRHADDPAALIAAAKAAVSTASVTQPPSAVDAQAGGPAPVSRPEASPRFTPPSPGTTPRRRWSKLGRGLHARRRRSWKP